MGSSSSAPKPITVTCHEWLELCVACPAKGCSAKKFDTVKWSHAGCGGQTQINSQALLRCATHSSNPYLITHARWDCGNHAGEFRETDLTKLTAAMTIAAAYYTKLGATAWVDQLVDSIAELR